MKKGKQAEGRCRGREGAGEKDGEERFFQKKIDFFSLPGYTEKEF